MTTEEIYTQIIAEKESGNYPELDQLSSTSKVAIWRLWVLIFAFFSKTIRDLFDAFKAYIESIFAKNQAGTLLWWTEQIKKFQYGDTLVFADGIFKYALIDVSKQIVKQVAIETLERLISIKVAAIDSGSNLVPLTQPQQDALAAYVAKIKFPGNITKIVSQDADNLKLTYRIYYNGQVVKADLETTIRNAASNYLANIVFNGKFSITEFTDELQKIYGVINPVYVSGVAKNALESDADYAEINDYYTAASGYMEMTELNLQFIADV
jgi:hypothetical protein